MWSAAVVWVALGVFQHQRDNGSVVSAHVDRQTEVGDGWHLVGVAFAFELAFDFERLFDAGRADGVAKTDQTAARIDWQFAVDNRHAVPDRFDAVAVFGEADGFHHQDF